MSRVYWHSRHGDAELLGRERAYAACMVEDMTCAQFPHSLAGSWLAQLFPDVGLQPGQLRPEAIRHRYFSVCSGAERIIFGDLVEGGFECALNTACVVGSDAVTLLARIHGQCEIHGWVDGPNRAWLASVIDRGREHEVLRPNMGWESVAELLRLRDDEPVATSYSVCEWFPSADWIAQRMPDISETDEGVLDALREDEELLWTLAIPLLRQEPGLEMSPDNWDDFGFGNGLSLFDFRNAALQARAEPARTEHGAAVG